MKAFWFILVSYLLLAACSSGRSTDTGNPGVLDAISDDESIYFTPQLLRNFCSSIKQCHSEVDLQNCQNNLLEDPNIVTSIGLDTETYESMSLVFEAERLNSIFFEENFVMGCVDATKSLLCDSPEMKSSFQKGVDVPFGEAYRAVPEACVYN